MIKTVLSFTLIVGPPLSEEQLKEQGNAALRAKDYGRAAPIWEQLAKREQLTGSRAGAVYAAVTAWTLDYKNNRKARSVCAGMGLLQWYFTHNTAAENELVVLYQNQVAIKQRDGITCKLRSASEARPLENGERVAATNTDEPPQLVVSPRPTQGITIAGALLTSVGVGGLAGMTVALVGHANSKRRLLDIGVHGPEAEIVYHQAKMFENGAIASGVTSGISLVTGVALLAVARHRKNRLTVTPQLGGLVLHGRF